MGDASPNSQLNLHIFRLAFVLCLALVLMPANAGKQVEAEAEEHGIGGGALYEENAEGSQEGYFPENLLSESIIELDIFSRPRVLLFDYYTVQSGDVISMLAVRFGLNEDSITSLNKITNTRLIQIGKVLKIPNQDGILHTVKNGETLGSIAESYKADIEEIKVSNELFSDTLTAGKDIFIPGARMDWVTRQEINGDLFIWPVSGAITSFYGYRTDPFNPGIRQFHTGLDISGAMGTPVRAAMDGRVSQVGYDDVLGNFIIISHHSGYRTLYAHLSVVRTRTGAYVAAGERIGDVGSTGLSTGPHLHFTVYKNGVTVDPRSLMR